MVTYYNSHNIYSIWQYALKFINVLVKNLMYQFNSCFIWKPEWRILRLETQRSTMAAIICVLVPNKVNMVHRIQETYFMRQNWLQTSTKILKLISFFMKLHPLSIILNFSIETIGALLHSIINRPASLSLKQIKTLCVGKNTKGTV